MMIVFKQLNKYQIIVIAVAVIFVSAISYILYIPIKIGNGDIVEFSVEEGSSLGQIAIRLKNAGLIRSKTIFIFYVLALGEEGNLKADTYALSKSLSLSSVVSRLESGLTGIEDIEMVVPEGSNIWEIDRRLYVKGLIKEGEFSAMFYRDEGFLFPDTYKLKRPKTGNSDASRKLEVDAMGQKMKDNFKEKTVDLFAGLSEEEIRKAVIIASMLEKEVYTYDEMRTVAGIINNRLELDRAFQIDATVSYGACLRDFIESGLTQNCTVGLVPIINEIRIDSEYNSYTRKDLPFGPISNPGLLALEAALNPKDTSYLYYLSPHGSTVTIFSRTGVEHEANRSKYLGL